MCLGLLVHFYSSFNPRAMKIPALNFDKQKNLGWFLKMGASPLDGKSLLT